MTGQVRKIAAAHYCCELAENALVQSDFATACDHLYAALKRDSNCARANLLLGRIAIEQGDYTSAIQALQAVPQQKPDFLSEILKPLQQCYHALDQIDALIDYLTQLHSRHRTGRLTAAMGDLIAAHQGTETALAFLEQQLQQEPSFIGLRRMVELKLERNGSTEHSDLQALYMTSRDMLDHTARYRCEHCGFTVKNLHWHCPSCKQWNSVKPLSDLVCRNKI